MVAIARSFDFDLRYKDVNRSPVTHCTCLVTESDNDGFVIKEEHMRGRTVAVMLGGWSHCR